MTASASPASTARVLLLMSPATYRAGAFLRAAERLGLEAIVGLDVPAALSEDFRGALPLDFVNQDTAVTRIVAEHTARPFAAILAIDDSAALLAALANGALDLPHNDPAAALAARDKGVMRERLDRGGARVPTFRRYPAESNPSELVSAITTEIGFPVVVKPTRLSGSRGVIRANDDDEFIAAWERTRRIARDAEEAPNGAELIVERYLPGDEVAVEALLVDGGLRVLAIFDKPDPLTGPFFEETIYVTPSRLPDEVQVAIQRETAAAAAALGLRHGPVHAELRINDEGVWPIELAGRSIGGLCSTILEFGTGVSLEELILRHAVGLPLPTTKIAGDAVGVMMIPIPGAGMLRSVTGQEDALMVPGVTGVEITAKLNQPVQPLPEGSSYLGFIFARGESAGTVEAALRAAHERLMFQITPIVPLRLCDA